MASIKPLAMGVLASAAIAACSADGPPAPVEFRGAGLPESQTVVEGEGPPPAARVASERREPAPVEFRGGTVRSEGPPAPRAADPPLQIPAPAPIAEDEIVPGPWQARPGPSLADFALKPEEARPFDWRNPPSSHRVQAGDTVFRLSALYQTPMRALIEANGLAAPFALTPGQELTLPPPRRHVVAAGETLLFVARTYAVDARSLALLNRLERPYRVEVGDSLVLPMDARARAALAAAPVEPASNAPERSASGRFAWPLRGEILARFGPAPGGRRIDGIDIAAPEGAAISAAAAGTVVYAGSDLAGYGHLALVQHPGGWVTAYARASALDVREGDRVRTGEQIGRVGRIGPGPTRLHFQVRQGRAPKDPLTVLSRS